MDLPVEVPADPHEGAAPDPFDKSAWPDVP